MTDLEKRFWNMSKDYKEQYKNCSWWRFKKKKELYEMWQSAIQCALRYANLKERKL